MIQLMPYRIVSAGLSAKKARTDSSSSDVVRNSDSAETGTGLQSPKTSFKFLIPFLFHSSPTVETPSKTSGKKVSYTNVILPEGACAYKPSGIHIRALFALLPQTSIRIK